MLWGKSMEVRCVAEDVLGKWYPELLKIHVPQICFPGFTQRFYAYGFSASMLIGDCGEEHATSLWKLCIYIPWVPGTFTAGHSMEFWAPRAYFESLRQMTEMVSTVGTPAAF